MSFVFLSIGLAASLFLGILLFLEIGRRIGVRRSVTRGSESRVGVGVVDSAVYAVLALLIGFTFSGAAERFNHRRDLVGNIANASSTTWKRIAMLPDEQQPAIRDGLKRYMDELIAYYAGPSDVSHQLQLPPTVTQAEEELWARSVAACKAPGGEVARMLLLPSLNETFDAVDTERMARRIHAPLMIYVMLGVAALATALFAGYGMASGTARNWMFTVGVAAVISVATYVTIELEFPRFGLLRVSGMDQVLVELRATMK